MSLEEFPIVVMPGLATGIGGAGAGIGMQGADTQEPSIEGSASEGPEGDGRVIAQNWAISPEATIGRSDDDLSGPGQVRETFREFAKRGIWRTNGAQPAVARGRSIFSGVARKPR